MNLGNSYTLDAAAKPCRVPLPSSTAPCSATVARRRSTRATVSACIAPLCSATSACSSGGWDASFEAAAALEQSIGIIEELRGNLSSVDVRSSFVSGKFYIYETLISILIENGDVLRAFEFVERAKARSFLDMLGNKSVGEGKERTPQVRQLVAEEQQLQQAHCRGGRKHGQQRRARCADFAAHQGVLSRLREADPEYASVKSIEPLPARRLQEMLDDSTAVLEYFIGDYSSFVFLLRPDTILVRTLSLDPEDGIDVAIERLRRKFYYDFPMQKLGFLREQRLGKGLSGEDALRAWRGENTDPSWQFDLIEMYSRLIFPVQEALGGIRQLYVVPHGSLHHLPFQALINPVNMDHSANKHMQRPRYLIEDYAIAYLPSASVLAFAQQKSLARASTAMIVGDPLYADPKYRRRPLDGALVEADTVAQYLDESLVLKREAAEERVVKSVMGTHDLLHFATHGELNKEDPLQSRILLAAASPDSANNGDLTVAKIFNLDLNAVLVTLSACQTAQLSGEAGVFTPGDDLVGLSRSFMYAGTPSVVASLWVVDDAATLAWMRHFYNAWLWRGQSKMQAARSAALAMLSDPKDPDWVFPYFWSAFVYLGDAR
jgi:CHAT domain-containing protein